MLTYHYHMGLRHNGHWAMPWPSLPGPQVWASAKAMAMALGFRPLPGPQAMAQDIRYPGVRVGEACGPQTARLAGLRDAKSMLTITITIMGLPAKTTSSSEYRYDPRGFQWVGGSAPHINLQH